MPSSSAAPTPPEVHRIFHALGDPNRRIMMERLCSGPASVSELATPFSMSLAAVVQHLHVLERNGLVRTEKIGRVRTCRVEPSGFASAEAWLDHLRTLRDCQPANSPADSPVNSKNQPDAIRSKSTPKPRPARTTTQKTKAP